MIQQEPTKPTIEPAKEEIQSVHRFVVNLPPAFYRPKVHRENIWWSAEPVAEPVGYSPGEVLIEEDELTLNSGRKITLIRRNSVDSESQQPIKRFFVREGGKLREKDDIPTDEWPLFGADRLSSDEPVVVTEGAKAAKSLIERGIQAVGLLSVPTNPATLEPLRNRDVILWPDNDETGVMLMSRMAASLQELAKRIRLLKWKDGPYKGDAADFGGDIQAFLETAEPLDPLFLAVANESPLKTAPRAPVTMRTARRMRSEIKGGQK